MSPQIWVVSGGKGGVGKTFVTASLGVTLSRQNKRVLLIDLDPSGANIHTSFGLDQCPGGMEKFWHEGQSLTSLIQSTNVLRVSLIRGLSNHWVPWTPSAEDADRLLSETRKLAFDHVIIDAGPGANQFQLELITKANDTFVVTNPEPPSIEKTYRLLESVLSYRWIQSDPKLLHNLVNESLLRYRKTLAASEIGFRDFVVREFPELEDKTAVKALPPMHLIVNGARGPQDHDLGFSIQSVSRKHFNVDLQYLGAVDYDNAVWQTTRNFGMVLVDKPLTPVTAQILAIVRSLEETRMDSSFARAVI